MQSSREHICSWSNSRADKPVHTAPPVAIFFYVECFEYVANLEDKVLDTLTQEEYNILKDCEFECDIVDQDVNWDGNEYIQIRTRVQVSSQQKMLIDLLGSMTYELRK
jgi:hypothetical protein